jgi:hypothetical protein
MNQDDGCMSEEAGGLPIIRKDKYLLLPRLW